MLVSVIFVVSFTVATSMGSMRICVLFFPSIDYICIGITLSEENVSGLLADSCTLRTPASGVRYVLYLYCSNIAIYSP